MTVEARDEPRQARREREADYAARWRDGAWLGQTLTTVAGERYTLIYQGRPGTGSGPDFRDAVLLTQMGVRVCGDVELHLRARNWQAHGHHHDRRYNGVVLHIVARGASGDSTTRRQDGGVAPVVALPAVGNAPRHGGWPCQSLNWTNPPGALAGLLRSLGEARLHERAAALGVALRNPTPPSSALNWSHRDVTLWLALAEALGYGRDRETLRDSGWRLITGSSTASMEGKPNSRLDAKRGDGLRHCLERWRARGPWSALESLLWSGSEREAAQRFSHALSAASDNAISPGRSAILTVNVALPFALAIADISDDGELARRALGVYARTPGLPSNTITRLLTRQLGLPRLPSGAQAQQGLHHVWARWCREKRCEGCPLATQIKIAATAGF